MPLITLDNISLNFSDTLILTNGIYKTPTISDNNLIFLIPNPLN